MKKLLDASTPLLKPADLVTTFTKKKAEELALPRRAIITFDSGDVKRILNVRQCRPADAWTPFRSIYTIDSSNTAITRSYFGGPNIAALVEELAAFGVKEFIIWGYCGSIGEVVDIGDIIMAEGALREDGTSYHYLGSPLRPSFGKGGQEGFSGGDLVHTDWLDHWKSRAEAAGFRQGLVWSCDAIYRETQGKVSEYGKMGILAVEMEVASFYAVCKFRELSAMAFLVVSDSLKDGKWTPGFHSTSFKQGVKRMAEFIAEKVIQ